MSAGQEHTQVPNPAPAHSVWTGTSCQPAWASVSSCVRRALCRAAGGGRIPRAVRDRAGDGCDSLQPSTCSVAVVICPPGALGSLEAKPKRGSQHLASCTHWPMGSVLQPGLDPGVGGDPTTK